MKAVVSMTAGTKKVYLVSPFACTLVKSPFACIACGFCLNSLHFACIAVFACIRWTGIQALAQTLHVVRFEFMKADAGGKRSCSHGTHAAELWLNHTRVVTDPKGELHSICRTP